MQKPVKRLWKVVGRDETGIGHAIIPDRIQPGSWILDAGCRRYDFVDGVLHLDKGCKILAVDPDPKAKQKRGKDVIFVQAALLNQYKKSITINTTQDPSTFFVPEERYKPRRQDLAKTFTAPVTTIGRLMKEYKIKEFSVVKFDIEGSEYDILMNWPGPIADQISCEFHDAYPGRNPYPDPEQYYKKLFKHIGQWYDIVHHKQSGPMWARNYWDSLFVRKPSK